MLSVVWRIKALKDILCIASVKPLEDITVYESALKIVSEERRRKAEKFCFASDRRLSVGAELLLQKAIKLANLPEKPLRFAFGSEGKPYLLEYDEVHFNLSHAGEYVLCALSGREVGCDLEPVRQIDLKVARQFFTSEETAQILRQPDEEAQWNCFYRLWTLKESFLKATGKGLKLDLNSFSVTLKENDIPVVSHGLDRHFSLREYELPGYRCAVCAEGGMWKAPLICLNFDTKFHLNSI